MDGPHRIVRIVCRSRAARHEGARPGELNHKPICEPGKHNLRPHRFTTDLLMFFGTPADFR
jgi:hypothetical protein